MLRDVEFKQKLCNSVIGLSHKDIDEVLMSVLKGRKLSKEAQMEQSLRDEVPEKLNPEIKSTRLVKRLTLEYILDKEEAALLVAASEQPIIHEPKPIDPTSYATYSSREVEALTEGNYDPNNFKRSGKSYGVLRRRSDKKKEQAR